MDDQLAYINGTGLRLLQGKIQAAKRRETARGSKITFLPSQQAKLTGERRGFVLGVKSLAAVMASKHVPMQCEGDPAEGSVGQDIWPSHSDMKPSGPNL